MSTGYQLIIGGVPNGSGGVTGGTDYSSRLSHESVQISRSNRQRGSQMTCTVTIGGTSIARPTSLSNIVLKNLNTGNNEFGGLIQISQQRDEIGPGTYNYQLTCSDYTRWLDHFPAGNKPYNALSVGSLVSALMADWVTNSSGSIPVLGLPAPAVPITTTHVQNITTALAAYNPNYLPMSQVLDQIAKMVEAVWFVDANADLWFWIPDWSYPVFVTQGNAPIVLNAAPVSYFDQQQGLTRVIPANTIAYLDLDANTTDYHDFHLSEDASLAITAVSAQNYFAPTTTQLTESPTSSPNPNSHLKGDGVTSYFALNYQPVFPFPATDSTRMIVTATISGILTTYTRNAGNLLQDLQSGQPTDSSPGNFCYVGTQSLRFGIPPDNSTNITVVYYYYQPSGDLTLEQNGLAGIIAGREGFGGGWYVDIISDPALTAPIIPTDSLTTWQIAELIHLNRYAQIKFIADFHSYTSGWAPGQAFIVTSAQRGDILDTTDTNWTGWGRTLTMLMYVTEVDSQIVNDGRIDHHIQACTSIYGV